MRAFLEERGFPELAALCASHYIRLPLASRTMTEEHLLYYADKRFIGETLVTIEERYGDFRERYAKGERTSEGAQWEEDARTTEKLLFPDGAPF